MSIILDRSICCNLQETISREWLITNDSGAYASGTIANVLTRMEHGLLVAYPPENTTPYLILAKIDEEVVFDQRTYYLGTNEYRDGVLNPSGFVHLEKFQLVDGFPVFTYCIGGISGILLEKRIWMENGHDTTYIQYRVLPAPANEASYRRSGLTGPLGSGKEVEEPIYQPIVLTLLPFTAYRPYNHVQYGNNDWHFDVHNLRHHSSDEEVTLPPGVVGCTIRAWAGAHPYHLLAIGHEQNETTFLPTNVWYWHFLRRQEAAQGKLDHDDLYLPGVIRTMLWPQEHSTLTIAVSMEALSAQCLDEEQIADSYQRTIEKQHRASSEKTTLSRLHENETLPKDSAHAHNAHTISQKVYSK